MQVPSSEANSADVEVWEFESESESDCEPLESAPQTDESSQLNSPVLSLVCTFSWCKLCLECRIVL